jgi:hypothetical protein
MMLTGFLPDTSDTQSVRSVRDNGGIWLECILPAERPYYWGGWLQSWFDDPQTQMKESKR